MAIAGIIIGAVPHALMVFGIRLILLLSLFGSAVGSVFSEIILSI